MALRFEVLDPPVFPEFMGHKGFKRVKVYNDAEAGDGEGSNRITAADFGLASLDSVNSADGSVTWDAESGDLSGVGDNGVELIVYGKLL